MEDFLPQAEYYAKEMGTQEKLKKSSVELLAADRESLVTEKKKAVQLEDSYVCNGARIFNIDPGMISLENVLSLLARIMGIVFIF